MATKPIKLPDGKPNTRKVMSTAGYPRTLYKYFSPDRVSTLDNAMLRYTPLGGFNDPFEGRPEITDLNTHEEKLEIISTVFPEEARKIYDQIPEKDKKNLNFQDFLLLTEKLMEANGIDIIKEIEKSIPAMKDMFHKTFDKYLGTLCLSEVPDSILMWSHYGSSHTGFAIGFNSHHPHFHERRSSDDELRHLRRVLYRDARPSARLSEMDWTDLVLTKSSHWSYEREWRIMRDLADANLVIPSEPFPIHLFEFPRDAVTSVILGARATDDTEKSIKSILQSHEKYKSTVLKRATPNESHFLLNIIPTQMQ